MDKRILELRERLWKKKAALQQKENLPVSDNAVTHTHTLTLSICVSFLSLTHPPLLLLIFCSDSTFYEHGSNIHHTVAARLFLTINQLQHGIPSNSTAMTTVL